jgi:hypothetical protein
MNELNWMLAVQDFTIQHAAVEGSSPLASAPGKT